MKPALIAVASALLTTPMIPPRVPRPAANHSGAVLPQIQPTDLSRLVWLAKADASKSLSGTKFSFPRQSRRARILADPAALRAGLAQLMSSSAQAMSRGRRHGMGLSVHVAAGRTILELRDEGPGLSVGDIAVMYGDHHTSLSEARRRLELAGGVVNVSSELGAGAVYFVEFPNAG